LFLKWPWPLETVESMDAARVREISLNGTPRKVGDVFLWDPNQEAENPLFLVSADPLPAEIARTVDRLVTDVDAVADDGSSEVMTAGSGPQVSNQFALVDADVILRYRVRTGGLIDFLSFCNGVKPRRSTLDMREQALQELALRVVTQTLSTLSLEDVLSPRGSTLPSMLRGRVQDVFDSAGAGVEVVSIAIPALRPPNEAVTMFEELSIDTQNSQKTLEEARRMADSSLAALVGDADLAREIVARIRGLMTLEAEQGRDAPAVIAERVAIQSLLRDSPGMISSFLAAARSLRWQIHMEARRNAAEVLGQVASYAAAPQVYRQRRIMDVFKETLPRLRAKYVLGVDPRRTDLDFEMQEPSQGLDLRDYLDDGADSGS
jgi:regulator of protease activity HflC (stomatin/prohibitin superfamily)